jgi:hypothetical protein
MATDPVDRSCGPTKEVIDRAAAIAPAAVVFILCQLNRDPNESSSHTFMLSDHEIKLNNLAPLSRDTVVAI